MQEKFASNTSAVNQKGVAGWMMFDWAAQPFFTVITTFIFAPYMVSRMVEDPDAGQAAWSFGIAIAGLFIAILSPILGSIADQTGSKKKWIATFATVKILVLVSLWFAVPGSSIAWVIGLLCIGTIAAEFSIVFNDSMMTHIVAKKDMGRVSNIAWGLGYAGGMLVLIFTVGFLAGSLDTGKTLFGLDPLFGLDASLGEDARATGPISALWYFVFIVPMFLFTPDVRSKLGLGIAVKRGLLELVSTIKEVRQRADIFKFLIARMLYQDGVAALLVLGGTFAAGVFGWPIIEIGVFGIILNVFAIGGCLAAAKLDDKFGSKWVVMFALVLLIIATIGISSTGAGFTLFGLVQLSLADSGGFYGTAAEKVYLLYGVLIGLAFGPVQASSRALLAQSVSEEEAGRYFGLYAMSGRATSFLAPLTVGSVTVITGSARYGMATLVVFLLVGLIILSGVTTTKKS